MNPQYYNWLFHTVQFADEFYKQGRGIVDDLWTTRWNEMKRILIPVPTADEQTAIAEYLAKEITRIDAIIAEAKASIEEYKKWKASIIYEAVTKGLDPNAEMKESGIDIIGSMPAHWETCRLKYLCDVMTGDQDTQNADENGEYPFYVRSPIIQRANVYTYDGEGILMAGDGAGAGRVFHHAFGKYAIHQRVYCFHNFRNINTEYYLYFISELFKKVMDKGSAQSTVPSVRLPMIQDFVFCIPSQVEQRKIVAYLNEKCSNIDSIVADKEALIADLESYKKSLIFEVVTGKRRVIE
jgi:type I restriction enzyme S subunit